MDDCPELCWQFRHFGWCGHQPEMCRQGVLDADELYQPCILAIGHEGPHKSAEWKVRRG